MVSVDGSVFIQVINFLFLIWIMNMVLYKPIRNVVAERKRKMLELESSIDTLSQNISDKDKTYHNKTKDIRFDGQKQKDAIIEVAVNEEKKMIEKINKSTQTELQEVKNKVKLEIDDVRRSLENDINMFAKTISHKILGRII